MSIMPSLMATMIGHDVPKTSFEKCWTETTSIRFSCSTELEQNVVALSACLQPFQSVICAATAHIATDECGAPVKFTGSPLKEIPTPDGKLTPELVRTQLHGFGFEHHSQPKVIAISQTTEMGTVYTPKR